MKVTKFTEKEQSTAELIVEVDAQTFDQAIEKSYKKNRGQIMVPGFRRGKAPRKMIERMYGASVFYEDAINLIAPDAFEKAVEEKQLKTVGQPSVDDVDISDEKVLTLTFITALYPVVKLGKYKGLSAEKTVESVKKKDIDTELEQLQTRNARIQTVTRKAKKGDTAVIDFEGFLDGVPFEGGKAEGHELPLGSGSFIPGFEEQVIGMKSGDEKDVVVTFPEDYSQDLAGKEAVFKVKCHEVKEQILPELDDEFAKDVSEFDTLDAYKKDIKERLTKQREEKAKEAYDDEILKQAVENMEVEIPDAMVDRALDDMMRDFYYNISGQGMDPDQYLQMMGMNMEGFRNASRPTALARVQTSLLLEAVAAEEKIEITEADTEEEYARMAEQYGRELKEIKKLLKAEDMTEDLKRKKAADLIYDNAKVAKAAAKKEEASEESAEEVKKAPAKKAPAKTAKADTAEKTEKAPAKKPAAKKTDTAEKKPAAKKAAPKKPAAKKESE